ncbi:MAG TPA: hypothetical protein VIL74_08955 [Pyrinomonadaceae bacterium]|jgi:hypothetical protein
MFGNEIIDSCSVCGHFIKGGERYNGLNLLRWHESCDKPKTVQDIAPASAAENCAKCGKPFASGEMLVSLLSMPPKYAHAVCPQEAEKLAAETDCPVCRLPLKSGDSHNGLMCQSFADEKIEFPQIVSKCDGCELPIFHGQARTYTADEKNYHKGCEPKHDPAFTRQDEWCPVSHKYCREDCAHGSVCKLKHNPYCDCGVCNFCDGSEDKFGNRRYIESRDPARPSFIPKEELLFHYDAADMAKDENCSGTLATNAQPSFIPNVNVHQGSEPNPEDFPNINPEHLKYYSLIDIEPYGEPETALRIRFVLLEKAIVTEIVSDDKQALGFSDKFSIPQALDMRNLRWWSYLDKLLDALFDSNTRIKTLVFPDAEHRIKEFEGYKQALTEFAENNAFYGPRTKPVEYLEKSDNGYILHRNPVAKLYSFEVPFEVINTLERIIDHKILPYEDKPMFTSTWRKISPPEFKHEKVAAAVLMTYEEASGSKFAVDEINRLLADLPEIWEFEMLKNLDSTVKIDAPTFFEDSETCGYCQRKPGEAHAPSCRQ